MSIKTSGTGWWVGAVFFLVLAGPACTEEEFGAPSLGDLSYNDEETAVVGGSIIISGRLDVEDNEGDVDTFLYSIVYPSGAIQRLEEEKQPFGLGRKQFQSVFNISLTGIPTPGIYKFRIQAKDQEGNFSNTLVGSFRTFQ